MRALFFVEQEIAVLIRTLDKDNKEVDVFEATDESAFIVQRCGKCEKLHLLIFKHCADKTATVCIDFTDNFAQQLIVELVRELREAAKVAPAGSGSTH